MSKFTDLTKIRLLFLKSCPIDHRTSPSCRLRYEGLRKNRVISGSSLPSYQIDLNLAPFVSLFKNEQMREQTAPLPRQDIFQSPVLLRQDRYVARWVSIYFNPQTRRNRVWVIHCESHERSAGNESLWNTTGLRNVRSSDSV